MPKKPVKILVTGKRPGGTTPWPEYDPNYGRRYEDIEGIEVDNPYDAANDPDLAANDPEYEKATEDELKKRGVKIKKGKLTIKDIIKWANRGRKAAGLTPAGLAEMIIENAVIGGLEYLNDKLKADDLTPEEYQLGMRLLEQTKNMPALTERAQILYAQSFGSGALVHEPELPGITPPAKDLLYQPEMVPVPVKTPYGVTVIGTTPNNKLSFDMTWNKDIQDDHKFNWFDDIEEFQLIEGDYVMSPGESNADVWTQEIELSADEAQLLRDIEELPFDMFATELEIAFDHLLGNLPESIPNTSLRIDGSVLGHLKVLIENDVRLNPDVDPARKKDEENKRRKDKKKKSSSLYLKALKLVDKTFGTITEIDDFVTVLQRNMRINQPLEVCVFNVETQHNDCIITQKDQRLRDLPLKYRPAVLKSIIEEESYIDLDMKGFIIEYAQMQVTDILIGLTTTLERHLIDEANVRGILDYGNLTTWIKRAKRFAESAGVQNPETLPDELEEAPWTPIAPKNTYIEEN